MRRLLNYINKSGELIALIKEFRNFIKEKWKNLRKKVKTYE